MNVNLPAMVLNTTNVSDSKQKNLKTSVDFAKSCALAALDKKAEEVVILDVSNLASYADCIVICSGLSERQAQAIARHVDAEMGQIGERSMGIEGLQQGHWILLDYGNVVFHVFSQEARLYYDLDGVWSDAKCIRFQEGIQSADLALAADF